MKKGIVMDKVISSPLTYWGGKRWLFKTLLPLIPEGTTEIFSPFLGGGSIEINLAHRGYTVHAYDNYAPLVNFWQHWLNDPEAVRLAVYELLSLYNHDELSRFRYKKDLLDSQQSVAFYYLQNKCAWNGKYNRKLIPIYLRSDGEYLIRPHEPQSYNIFNNFDFWQSKPLSTLNINHADFEQVFWIHNHQFAYIDPPYFGIEGEYGGSRKNGFNHEKLRELVDGRKKTAISYNDHPKAYELYDGFHIQQIKRGSDGKQHKQQYLF